MEKLKRNEFNRKYGQGHDVFTKADIDEFNKDTLKTIEANPGFKSDIISKAKAQLLTLEPVVITDEFGKAESKVYVKMASPVEDREAFEAYRGLISKGVQDDLISAEKADELIEKAGRKYNVGDISDATGLQKQADGSWAPPDKGKKSSKKDDGDKGGKKKKSDNDSKSSKKKSDKKSSKKETGSDDKKQKLDSYLNSMDESEINRFKEDVTSGELDRDLAIEKLKSLGMEDAKAEKLISGLVPDPTNIEEFSEQITDGRMSEDRAIKFMQENWGMDENAAKEFVEERSKEAKLNKVEESLGGEGDDDLTTVAKKEDEPGATENDTGGTKVPDKPDGKSAEDIAEENTLDYSAGQYAAGMGDSFMYDDSIDENELKKMPNEEYHEYVSNFVENNKDFYMEDINMIDGISDEQKKEVFELFKNKIADHSVTTRTVLSDEEIAEQEYYNNY